MKFFYLRNKVTSDIVVATFNSNNEGSWVNLSFGGEGEQPYFGSRKELIDLVDGRLNDSWSHDISSDVKKDCAVGLVEIVEIEL